MMRDNETEYYEQQLKREGRLAALREMREMFSKEQFDLDPRQCVAMIDALIKREEEER